jgi:hypothetical protein
MRTKTYVRLGGWMLAGLLLGAAGCDPQTPPPDPGAPNRYFQTRLSFAAGVQPFVVAAADLNGDGRQDLAVANFGDSTVSVLLATPEGGYAAKVDHGVGTQPVAIVVADLDGDLLPDLLTANRGAGNLSALYNEGGGVFGAQVLIPLSAGSLPNAVATADLNGDGALDLAVTFGTPGIGTLAILLASGAGYTAPALIPVGEGPRAVLAAELTGDAALDLVTTNRNAGSLTLLAGVGDGTFTAGVALPAGDAPRMTALADLDGDLAQDLVTTNPGDGSVTTLLGDGAGGFVAGDTLELPALPSRFTLVDLNDDDAPDIATTLYDTAAPNPALGQVAVLLGDGAGSFGELRVWGTGALAEDVIAADMNADGKLDLVTANTGIREVSVILGKGTGDFQTDERLPGGEGARIAAIADLNGDTRPDGLVVNQLSSNLSVVLGQAGGMRSGNAIPTSNIPRGLAIADLNDDARLDVVVTLLNQNAVAVFLNAGGNTFQAERRFGVRGPDQQRAALPRSVAVGDLNGDGIPDLVTGNSGTDSIGILLGTGGGQFAVAQEFAPSPASNFPLDVQLVDLNGDGKLDLVFLSTNDPEVQTDAAPPRVVRVLGKGDGTFDPDSAVRVETGPSPRGLAADDLDGDGDIDVVTSHAGETNVYLLAGNASGSFLRGAALRAGGAANSAAFADVNGDGRRDIVTTNDAGTVSVLRNLGGLSFLQDAVHGVGDEPIGAALGDLNGDGRPDLVVGNRGSEDVSVVYGIRP